MSYAMDDLGISKGVNSAFEANFIEETRTVEKQTDSQNTGHSKEEPYIEDDFSVSKRHSDEVHKAVENFQEENSEIDIVLDSLDNIKFEVEKIKEEVASDKPQEEVQKNIDESYDKILRIARETSFNDKALIDIKANEEATKVSLEELDVNSIEKIQVETQEEKAASREKLNDVVNNIESKKAEFAQIQQDISVNVNSIVELKRVPEEENVVKIPVQENVTEVPDKNDSEELKETVVEDIKTSPVKAREVQIKHIDRDLLLAMLSLRVG